MKSLTYWKWTAYHSVLLRPNWLEVLKQTNKTKQHQQQTQTKTMHPPKKTYGFLQLSILTTGETSGEKINYWKSIVHAYKFEKLVSR